jgi:hypothetical protein
MNQDSPIFLVTKKTVNRFTGISDPPIAFYSYNNYAPAAVNLDAVVTSNTQFTVLSTQSNKLNVCAFTIPDLASASCQNVATPTAFNYA